MNTTTTRTAQATELATLIEARDKLQYQILQHRKQTIFRTMAAQRQSGAFTLLLYVLERKLISALTTGRLDQLEESIEELEYVLHLDS